MRSKSFTGESAEGLDAQLNKFFDFCNVEDFPIHHVNRGFFQLKHKGEMVSCHYAHIMYELKLNNLKEDQDNDN